MDEQPTTLVAGEPLGLLEEAFHRLDFEVESCGCVTVSGPLPAHLSDCLVRALISTEVEMIEHGVEPYSGPGTDPFSELMVQVIAAGIET